MFFSFTFRTCVWESKVFSLYFCRKNWSLHWMKRSGSKTKGQKWDVHFPPDPPHIERLISFECWLESDSCLLKSRCDADRENWINKPAFQACSWFWASLDSKIHPPLAASLRVFVSKTSTNNWAKLTTTQSNHWRNWLYIIQLNSRWPPQLSDLSQHKNHQLSQF